LRRSIHRIAQTFKGLEIALVRPGSQCDDPTSSMQPRKRSRVGLRE
jgi:hypothetical protein